MDERLKTLKSWIGEKSSIRDYEIRPASGDASFRRYFRVTAQGRSVIAVDAPPQHEDSRPFIEIAERFLALGLNVPKILEADTERGFLLISDLGERLYLPHLRTETVERMYGDAMGALVILQAGSFTPGPALPPYDRALLCDEMELFRIWYLGKHQGAPLNAEGHAILDEVFESLARSALEQPRVWVHRDYHSRNLMLTERNNPGILDFQDAVSGPVTYDLVSLLRDCYISWPREQVEGWVKGYYELGRQSGLTVGDDETQFLRWFDRMGVQRHLKAIGIFARLHHRDGKPNYLAEIPRVMGYVLEVSTRYPDLRPLHDLLTGLGHNS